MIIPSSDKPFLRIYECGICRKTFSEFFDHTAAAHLQAATYGTHKHQAGTCCHLGEVEIDAPILMEITQLIEGDGRTIIQG